MPIFSEILLWLNFSANSIWIIPNNRWIIHPDNDFKQQLKALLKEHPNVDVKAMGFPANWNNEPLWK